MMYFPQVDAYRKELGLIMWDVDFKAKTILHTMCPVDLLRHIAPSMV